MGVLASVSLYYLISDERGCLHRQSHPPQAVFGPHSGEPGSTDSTVAPPVKPEKGGILNTDHKPEIDHAGERGRDKLNVPIVFNVDTHWCLAPSGCFLWPQSSVLCKPTRWGSHPEYKGRKLD